jgi:RNA polymerase sigma-70 factor (ECF subfamily)
MSVKGEDLETSPPAADVAFELITEPRRHGHSQGMLPNTRQPATDVETHERLSVWSGQVPQLAQPLELEVLYASHFDFVWRSARRLGVPAEALDDVVQDVFLVVHRKLSEFEQRSSVRSWLFGITRRVVRDLRRSVLRKPVDWLEDDPQDLSASAPDDLAVLHQRARLLHALLATLDEDKREAFVLAELEQMSGPEIAEALQLNLNTAYARVRTAREAFEAALSRHEARIRNSRRAP